MGSEGVQVRCVKDIAEGGDGNERKAGGKWIVF